jgi:hypothetical protein
MKKYIGVTFALLLLSGCATAVPTDPKPTHTLEPAPSFAMPVDCEIDSFLKLDPKFEAFNQTEDGATGTLDCAIGVPNSDVGIFFGYSKRTDAEWAEVTKKLSSEGYKQWDAQYPLADVWRVESGLEESEGVSCMISGHVGEISFSVTEPWTKCDDTWNRQMVSDILNHALVS